MAWITLERPEKPVFGLPEIFGAIGLLFLFVARFVPLSLLPFWGCTLKRFTGIPCLSCGMTRSFDWFMRGRFVDAFLINPLGFLLALAAAIAGLYFLLWRLRLPRVRLHLPERAGRWVRLSAVVLVCANWGYVVAATLLAKR